MRSPLQARPVLRNSLNPGRRIAARLLDGGVAPSCDLSVSGTISNGQACINTPIGNECVSVPSFVPNGTAFQVCGDLCTSFGIPTGICITVTALGQQVASECFGLNC